MNSEISLRALRLEDCEAVCELASHTLPEHWSVRSLEEALRFDYNVYFVAVRDRRIVGFAGIMVTPPDADLLNIAVDPALQRQGIAQLLLGKILEEARRRQAERMMLEVRSGNHAARRLYEKYGFAELGKRKDYYANPREDAVIMEKWL